MLAIRSGFFPEYLQQQKGKQSGYEAGCYGQGNAADKILPEIKTDGGTSRFNDPCAPRVFFSLDGSDGK